jgi:hypothetical protein
MQNFDDIQKMGQQNFDTAMKGFGEWGRTWQTIANEASSYTKRSVEEGSAHMEKLSSARSLDQVMSIQTDFAKRAYEDYVAQMTKMSSMYVEMARDAYRPMEAATEQAMGQARAAASEAVAPAKKRSSR